MLPHLAVDDNHEAISPEAIQAAAWHSTAGSPDRAAAIQQRRACLQGKPAPPAL